jgi:dTDP-4-amino-4,6-dideoxygalactose transaminase
MKNVEFYNLPEINKKYEKKFISDFKKINSSGRYIIGKFVKRFENQIANYCGVKYAVGVGNCVDAIKLSFMALKQLNYLKDGDHVIVPANTYIASIIGVISANLIPVPIDADLITYNLSICELKKNITKKTKAILVADLYGHPSNINEISKISKKFNLKIVNDAAQSFGGAYKKKAVGNFYDITCFSFFPGKNLGAFGDGGAIVTNSTKIRNIIASLRNYGEKPFKDLKDRKYINNFIGVNSRLDEIQASILTHKLKNFKKDQSTRNKIASYYKYKINNPKIDLPICIDNYSHAWHLFVIRCKTRNKLRKYLKKNNIDTMLHYPKPFYKQPAFKKYKFKKFPITEKIYKEILSIPLHTSLKSYQIKNIVKKINKF